MPHPRKTIGHGRPSARMVERTRPHTNPLSELRPCRLRGCDRRLPHPGCVGIILHSKFRVPSAQANPEVRTDHNGGAVLFQVFLTDFSRNSPPRLAGFPSHSIQLTSTDPCRNPKPSERPAGAASSAPSHAIKGSRSLRSPPTTTFRSRTFIAVQIMADVRDRRMKSLHRAAPGGNSPGARPLRALDIGMWTGHRPRSRSLAGPLAP